MGGLVHLGRDSKKMRGTVAGLGNDVRRAVEYGGSSLDGALIH